MSTVDDDVDNVGDESCNDNNVHDDYKITMSNIVFQFAYYSYVPFYTRRIND